MQIDEKQYRIEMAVAALSMLRDRIGEHCDPVILGSMVPNFTSVFEILAGEPFSRIYNDCEAFKAGIKPEPFERASCK